MHCKSEFKFVFEFKFEALQINYMKFIIHKSKKEGKDRESIQSSTTPDPGYQWESDNVTIRHHKRKPRGQPSPSR